MKIILLTVVMCLIFNIGHTQTDTLNNNKVIEMIELGFEDEVVIAKIKSSICNFITDIESLKSLKSKGASSSVVKAMIEAQDGTKKEQAKVLADEAKDERREGVYILSADNQQLKIFPTLFSGTSTSSLGAALTSGIVPDKVRSTIHGAKSRNVVQDADCSFMFYFIGVASGRLHDSDWWFRTAKSPNQFSLIRLRQKTDRREIEIGSTGIFSGKKSGVKDKYIVAFTIEQIDDLTFKVTPTAPLEPGEYCFYYQGMMPQSDNYKSQSVFDFTVGGSQNNENSL